MYKLLYTLLAITLLIASCGTPKTVMAPEMEFRDLDTLVITPDPEDYSVIEVDGRVPSDYRLPVYRAAYERKFDLLHTKLTLRFDWEKEQVIGQAELRLTPLSKMQRQLRLDAKGFEFKAIRLANSNSPLNYSYDNGQEVFIELGRDYRPGEEINLYIDYVATPAASGGSSAITSDKGLYFINPRGETPGQPKQIWTQGETESNSRWFPTIDKPNERCTQEMVVTVKDNYKVLSNGTLMSSTANGDGTRTDYWKMDLPHAPYLFMLAIGEFSVVEDDNWNGIPVDYWVEKEYESYAEDIFPYTPEMLTFFSELTGVDYPWPKYSQVVVREYVSGAMENTTGVIFGDFMYGDERELMDAEVNEKIVAHEMFHHWFGDYVTCESWSNLTLNEGFANYSEYLWLEKKHGRDAADEHLLTEWAGYLGSLANGSTPHELIWTDYEDKEDMFDAHSYNKGGAVLHMLRNYLGDDVFFASLEYYLTENQYSPVEVDELRIAFEEKSGQDLNWFFNQWFHQAGHPQLSLEYGFDAEAGEAYVDVKQTQLTTNNVPAVFQLPVAVDVYTKGSALPQRYDVMINQRSQRLTFPSTTKPDAIIFDAEHQLLAEIDQELSDEALINQFRVGKRLVDRMMPLEKLDASLPAARQITKDGLQDPYGAVRLTAIGRLSDTPDNDELNLLRLLAGNDTDSEVRAAALDKLAEIGDEQVAELATQALKAKSYLVVGSGLTTLASIDPELAAREVKTLESSDSPALIRAIAGIYGTTGDPANIAYFNEKMDKVDGQESFAFYGTYLMLLMQADEVGQINGLDAIKSIAESRGQSPWRRLAAYRSYVQAYQGISAQADETDEVLSKRVLEMNNTLKAIRDNEPAGQIKDIFGQMFPD
ncbi:alanyl aminopeptidase [Lewinellaceae bacterium SD302]|nr:alanyl aminopeptidase [Lewinellaceae bacterium SD302]